MEGEHIHAHGDGGHVHGGAARSNPEKETRAIVNRLSRAIGHLESIKRMVEDERDCSDVLIQLSAVRSALNSAGKLILQNHIVNGVADAVRNSKTECVEELGRAIDRFFK